MRLLSQVLAVYLVLLFGAYALIFLLSLVAGCPGFLFDGGRGVVPGQVVTGVFVTMGGGYALSAALISVVELLTRKK